MLTYQCLRACLHGGGGDPYRWGNMFCGSPHISCKRDQIKMRDYMDRRVTSPISLTSRNACNGDNGENRQTAGDSNWMPLGEWGF